LYWGLQPEIANFTKLAHQFFEKACELDLEDIVAKR
jgi:hypothetical protein